jgi:hypothetical protein
LNPAAAAITILRSARISARRTPLASTKKFFRANPPIVFHHSHKKNSPATINRYYSQAQSAVDPQKNRRMHVL